MKIKPKQSIKIKKMKIKPKQSIKIKNTKTKKSIKIKKIILMISKNGNQNIQINN